MGIADSLGVLDAGGFEGDEFWMLEPQAESNRTATNAGTAIDSRWLAGRDGLLESIMN